VLHVSSSRNLILKAEAEALPKANSKVVDENLKVIGTALDVFGPVSSPYVAVKPVVSNPQHYVGNMLYTFPSQERRKEKKKYGR